MWRVHEQLRQPRQPPASHRGRLVQDALDGQPRAQVLAHQQPVHRPCGGPDIAAAGGGDLITGLRGGPQVRGKEGLEELQRVDHRDGQEDRRQPLVPGLQLADVPTDQVGELRVPLLIQQLGRQVALNLDEPGPR